MKEERIKELCSEMLKQLGFATVPKDEQCEMQGDYNWQIAMATFRTLISETKNIPVVIENRNTEPKELVNSPNHYNMYSVEAFEMARRIWGNEAVATTCEIDAFYYRMRLGHKDNVEQELKKEAWNLNKAEELRK